MSAACSINRLATILEHTLDLLIKLVAVCHNEHARIGLVLQNPFGQQHHYDAFPTALRVPDDSSLVSFGIFLRGLDSDVLMHAGQLLYPAIEEDEIVEQLDKPLFVADFEQILVELEARVVLFIFLPFQEIFLGCSDCSVAQTFGIVSGENDLHRAEEPAVEAILLIGKNLQESGADRDVAIL